MLQRLFFGILFLGATASLMTSPAWADDLPPYFSTLKLTAEQSESVEQLVKDHSSLPADKISPDTEREFFTSCWKVLTDEQRAAWNKAARATLVVPEDWKELGLSEEQKDLMARPCALFRPHIDAIERDLPGLCTSILETKKDLLSAVAPRLVKEISEAHDKLVRQALKAMRAKIVWETAIDWEMRGYLTDGQRTRLLAAEATELLPTEYVKLGLTDDQLATLASKLKSIVPPMWSLKDANSRLAVGDPRLRGIRESLAALERELSEALYAVATDVQRAQLKNAKKSR